MRDDIEEHSRGSGLLQVEKVGNGDRGAILIQGYHLFSSGWWILKGGVLTRKHTRVVLSSWYLRVAP